MSRGDGAGLQQRPGVVGTKRFAHAPHSVEGNFDYTKFTNEMEDKNKELMLGDAIAR